MEFQRINKQMTAKPIVDYFERVCDANIMHVTLSCSRIGGKLADPHMLWSEKLPGLLQNRNAYLADVRYISLSALVGYMADIATPPTLIKTTKRRSICLPIKRIDLDGTLSLRMPPVIFASTRNMW